MYILKKVILRLMVAVLLAGSMLPIFIPDKATGNDAIIADHTVVDKYNQIPSQWIDEVKKMYLNVAGESHSRGYMIGLDLLELLNTDYQASVNTEEGVPEPYREDALRANKFVRNMASPYPFTSNGWFLGTGEAQWYTWHAWDDPAPAAANATRIINHIDYCNTNNLTIAAIGFGWCWDMSYVNGPDGGYDNIGGVQFRWAGTSIGGPDGDKIWGLDEGDIALTGNNVTMKDYLQATEEYISHVQSSNTTVFFTTGPVDTWVGEAAYQREIKQQYIRDYVTGHGKVLFDYADILTHNDAGVLNQSSWNGTLYPQIHPDNLKDYDANWNKVAPYVADGDHIGQVGALRLGKAMWWLLARLAGWDGTTNPPSNHAPVAGNQAVSTKEDTVVAITLTATDADSDNLTYSIVTPPSHGGLSGTVPSVTYTPVANYNGSDNFTFKANDGQVDSNTANITITVNPVNDAPSFTKGGNQIIVSNAGPQTVTGWATGISAGPPDESGQVLNFLVSSDNNSLFSVPPAVATNGTLTYTPADGAVGSTTVTVRLHDNGGTANGGVDTSAPQTFLITINLLADTQSPSVTVISPNGGEKRKAGYQYNITWTATDNVGVTSANISYSTDNGTSYTNIATGEANDGVYSWTVPNTPSMTCLVRVQASDAAGNWGQDTSNAVFQIFGSIPGDANNDCVVDVNDITKTERIILGLDLPTPDADANGDTHINVLDITRIERIILGL